MAMSAVFCLMLLLSVLFGLINGQLDQVSQAAIRGGKKAVELCLMLAGPLCLWSGFGSLLEGTGIEKGLIRVLSPILTHLFPQSSGDEAVMGKICGNVTANLLGLGNAATPLGIRAAKAMANRAGQGTATDEMCRFIVLNTASIQLLPTTVAALRGSLGAAHPFDILVPVWLTSLLSVIAGLSACAVFSRWRA